jgi:hypothetical protein
MSTDATPDSENDSEGMLNKVNIFHREQWLAEYRM